MAKGRYRGFRRVFGKSGSPRELKALRTHYRGSSEGLRCVQGDFGKYQRIFRGFPKQVSYRGSDRASEDFQRVSFACGSGWWSVHDV